MTTPIYYGRYHDDEYELEWYSDGLYTIADEGEYQRVLTEFTSLPAHVQDGLVRCRHYIEGVNKLQAVFRRFDDGYFIYSGHVVSQEECLKHIVLLSAAQMATDDDMMYDIYEALQDYMFGEYKWLGGEKQSRDDLLETDFDDRHTYHKIMSEVFAQAKKIFTKVVKTEKRDRMGD